MNMKKITLIAVATFGYFALLAQPTITSSDFPGVGTKFAFLNDNRGGAHTVTAGGANLTWDYSSGYYVVSDTSFTNLIAPSAVPNGGGSNFPNATAAEYAAKDSVAVFYVVNSTGYYIDGT